MVCSKCAKLTKPTSLATPGVKKKNDMYYGSPAGTSKGSDKTSATLGQTGVGKSKLLSKAARNPYATYSSSCSTCHTKIDQGRKKCNKCAYKEQVCAMCGKANSKSTASAPVVAGQKFTLK